MDKKTTARLIGYCAKVLLRIAVTILNIAHRILTEGGKLANLDHEQAELFSANLIALYLNTHARPYTVLAHTEKRYEVCMHM